MVKLQTGSILYVKHAFVYFGLFLSFMSTSPSFVCLIYISMYVSKDIIQENLYNIFDVSNVDLLEAIIIEVMLSLI